MAFKEVNKTARASEIRQLKSQHKALQKKYDSLKYRFLEAIKFEDFEVLSLDDYLELKELYILKKQLFWKIHQLENPEDTATEEAYRFLNTMSHNDQIDFLRDNGLTTHELIRRIEKNPNFISEVTA